MPSLRYLPVAGTADLSCTMCAGLGLGGDSRPLAPDWLKRSGYTHLLRGCGPAAVDDGGLTIARVVHEPRSVPEEAWLVIEKIDAKLVRDLPEGLRVVWMPRRSGVDLADQARLWPRERCRDLHIYWPHFRKLSQFGWTWKELLRQQRHLWNSFPHIQWSLPHGWDHFNPEVELETAPVPYVLDRRRPEFAPEISVIIPSYDSLATLRSTVTETLNNQANFDFEVIVADDGSRDGTPEWLASRCDDRRLIALRLPRPEARVMGAGGFRAGIARNAAAAVARGRILLFLDADILIPPNYLEEHWRLHACWDLVQGTRLQLKHEPERVWTYAEVAASDLETLSEYWGEFQSRDWKDLDSKWKFTSTFCLSIARDRFFALGAFRRSFNKYGFEDTDLGYRADRAGMRFHRSETPVYHFKHPVRRSEYRRQARRKSFLLRDSARVFFLNNPQREVFEAIPHYLEPALDWRERFSW